MQVLLVFILYHFKLMQYTEESKDVADDFLGRTVYDWENEAKQVEKYGVRTAFIRDLELSLVVDGGALPLMALPYKLFVGGTVGSGVNSGYPRITSWMLSGPYHLLLRTIRLSGPVNVTASFTFGMRDFGKTIGSVLNRLHWFPAPSFAMKWVLGQKSKLVLEGAKSCPQSTNRRRI